ncbi:MAG: hypothetical protein JWQ66_3515 [Mucilaginibacter sp.]|nr:hypothetical protein [Mucilaginibacter sp.]
MTDDLIIQQLKDKEAQLLKELNRVQLALNAFIDRNISFGNTTYQKVPLDDIVPRAYDTNLTYSSKILFVLYSEARPMLVDEIVEEIQKLEPEFQQLKLHKSVSHNLSMLAKYSKVKKHPYNRKIKYSL